MDPDIPPKPPDPPLTIYNPPSPAAYQTIGKSPEKPLSQQIYNEMHNLNKKKDRKQSKKTNILDSNRQLNYEPSSSSGSEFEVSGADAADSTVIPAQQVNETAPVSQNTFINRPYTEDDAGPFIIHVQRIESDPKSGTTLHPVSFGHCVKKAKITGITEGGIKRIGRNRISVQFSSHIAANKFIENPILQKYKFNAFIPTFNICRLGIVKGIPEEWSPEEIIEELSAPPNKTKVLKIRRMNYKTFVDGIPQWKPSQTVVLTFDGQVLPNKVFMYYNALPVEKYLYPTIQCFTCCRFGHTKNICRSKPRCAKCGDNHSSEDCIIDPSEYKCLSCSGNHLATNRSCPEHIRQKNIKIEMAEKSLSYIEASKLFPPVKKSYAEVTNSQPNPTQFPSLSQSQLSPQTTSYRKTVFSRPSLRAPLQKGYDQKAHRSILNEFIGQQSQNGCALLNNSQNENLQEESIKSLIETLVKILSNSPFIPSNVATKLEALPLIINALINENSTVELQEHSS